MLPAVATLDLTAFAAKLGLTRERIRQLVAEGRISPKPKLVPFGRRGYSVYFFASNARRIGADRRKGRSGRKKRLDKANERAHD